jgi:hypothetical protein
MDKRITTANTEIATAVEETGTSLTELCGIGNLTAGKILARIGSIHRFRSAAALASFTGTAPTEVSSGDVVRHRQSRAGDRQLNSTIAPHHGDLVVPGVVDTLISWDAWSLEGVHSAELPCTTLLLNSVMRRG